MSQELTDAADWLLKLRDKYVEDGTFDCGEDGRLTEIAERLRAVAGSIADRLERPGVECEIYAIHHGTAVFNLTDDDAKRLMALQPCRGDRFTIHSVTPQCDPSADPAKH